MKNFTLEKTMPLNLIGFNEVDGYVEFMRYQLTFSMVTNSFSADGKEIEQAQLQQSTSFSKAITFIDGVLNGSVVITNDMSEDVKRALMVAYQNNVILLPDCTEVYLVSAIHKKLNTITSENTIVEMLILKDLDNDISYNYSLVDDVYDELPVASEWLGEYSVWEEPWWDREDVSTMDKRVETEEEYDEMMSNIDLDQLNELNQLALRDIEDSVLSLVNSAHEPDGELIEVDFKTAQSKKPNNWSPKLV